MIYHSKIKTFDVFYYKKTKHYYVCVYSQTDDVNNILNNDIYGAVVTTNSKYEDLIKEGKNDYNVKVNLNNTTGYVCCDKIIRIKVDKHVVKKTYKLTTTEKNKIQEMFNKFINEIKRQMDKRSDFE